MVSWNLQNRRFDKLSDLDLGFQEFRNLWFRGAEGLEVDFEVDFEVTRVHVETSPLWRLLNFGIEYFQRKKFRVVSWMEDLRSSEFRV